MADEDLSKNLGKLSLAGGEDGDHKDESSKSRNDEVYFLMDPEECDGLLKNHETMSDEEKFKALKDSILLCCEGEDSSMLNKCRETGSNARMKVECKRIWAIPNAVVAFRPRFEDLEATPGDIKACLKAYLAVHGKKFISKKKPGKKVSDVATSDREATAENYLRHALTTLSQKKKLQGIPRKISSKFDIRVGVHHVYFVINPQTFPRGRTEFNDQTEREFLDSIYDIGHRATSERAAPYKINPLRQYQVLRYTSDRKLHILSDKLFLFWAFNDLSHPEAESIVSELKQRQEGSGYNGTASTLLKQAFPLLKQSISDAAMELALPE